MAAPTRHDVMIQLDKIDTELETPDADKSQLMAQASDWLAANPSLEPADALYYRERLQAIRERHKIGCRWFFATQPGEACDDRVEPCAWGRVKTQPETLPIDASACLSRRERAARWRNVIGGRFSHPALRLGSKCRKVAARPFEGTHP